MGTGLIGLSPHSDDLAFSLGAALCDGRLAGCLPVTVYSRSGYTRRQPAGDPLRVSALRRAEDRRFFAHTAARAPLWLEQPDAPLRGIPFEVLSSAPVEPAAEESLCAVLDTALPAAGTLLAPLGLGGHVDHRLVCAAACRLFRRGRHELWLYEDLPYAAFMEPAAIVARVREVATLLGLPLHPHTWESRALEQAKQWAVQSYASQTDAPLLRALLQHARRVQRAGLPAERVWVPETTAGLETSA